MSLPRFFCQSRTCFHYACIFTSVFALFLSSTAMADDPRNSAAFWDSIAYTPISEMQAVTSSGATSWAVPRYNENGASDPDGDYKAYKLRGVVTHDPYLMLNSDADYREGPMWYMGGQWQAFVQSVSLEGDADNCPELAGDFGGVALWMGQNYGNHYKHYGDWEYNYSNETWENTTSGYQVDNEMDRLNYPIDISTGLRVNDPLRAGDIIEIRARGGVAYCGKFNCNEEHDNGASGANMDFDIYLISRNSALSCTDIELSDVKDSSNTDIFDASRLSGGELYQGQRVRLKNVTITNPEQWGLIDPSSIYDNTDDPGEYYTIHVTDAAQERTFNILLGENSPFAGTSAPTEPVDIIGIFDQESSSNAYGVDGYQLWALSPDDFIASDLLPGDANSDGTVNELDATIMAANWNRVFSDGAKWRQGDFNFDGQVNKSDAALMAENWLQSSTLSAAVPEPGMVLLLCSCGLMFCTLRKRDYNR